MAYLDDVLALSPDHYWELQTNVLATVGGLNGANSGVTSSAPGLQPDATASALFERGSDTISVASSATLNDQTITAFTCSMIFQPNLDTLPFTLVKIGGTNQGLHMFLAGGMVPAFTVISGGVTETIFADRPLIIAEAAHIAFRYNAGAMEVFIDGRLVASSTSGPTQVVASQNVTYIGGQGATSGTVSIPGGEFTIYTVSGRFSDLAIWLSALTDAQIYDELFAKSAIQKSALVTFTSVPDKTEVRLFDLGTPGLDEIGSGEEYVNFGPVDLTIQYDVETTVTARLVILNVEDRYLTVSEVVDLPREGITFPVDLLLVEDRVYDNDFLQEFPPANVIAPVIAGIGAVGEVLTVTDTGTWTGSAPINFTYQWLRSGVPISGATASSYTTVLADDLNLIACRITGTNSLSSADAVTNFVSLFPQGQYSVFEHSAAASPTTAVATLDYNVSTKDEIGIAASGGEYTLPVGTYLFVYQAAWIASGQNGRGQSVVHLEKDGVQVPGSRGSGYQRDTANDAAWANGVALVQADGTNAFRVRHFLDADLSVGTYDQSRTTLQIIKLTDGNAFAHYGEGGGQAYGSSTYSNANLSSTITETAPAIISRTGQTVTLAANRKFMVCGGVGFNSTSARTSRFTRLIQDGVGIPGSYGYSYMRDASNEYGAPNSFAVIETGGASVDINLQVRHPLAINGATVVTGNASSISAASGLMIAELPSNADWYFGTDTVAGQDISAASVAMNIGQTVSRLDSGIFSARNTASLTAGADKDLLMVGSIMAQRTGANGTRSTREASWQVGGVNQNIAASGEYNRGDQGSQDAFDSVYNPRGIVSVTSGDALTLTVNRDADAGWGNGGAGPAVYAAEPPGYYAIDLSTL